MAPEAVPPTPLAPAPVSRIEPPVIDADYVANADAFRPPPVSRRLGEYGTVLLRVTISAEGRASRVELLKSSGYPRLDEAAMNGARQTRFKPATRDGKPVEFAYNWPVKYDPS